MITTILISGRLTKERLDRAVEEMRHVAASAMTTRLVLIFNSSGGDPFAALRFLDTVLGDQQMRSLAERAEVKIYEAYSPAALLALTLGSQRKLAKGGSVGFHAGEVDVQVGNPEHLDQDGHLATWIAAEWERYRQAVAGIMDRPGLAADPKLQAEFWATGRLELSAPECLRRGLVSRLF